MSDAEQNEPWQSLACIDAWSCTFADLPGHWSAKQRARAFIRWRTKRKNKS